MRFLAQIGADRMLAAATDAASASHDQVMIGLVALLTAMLGLLGWLLKVKLGVISESTSSTNAAVNHKETGELSLYRHAVAIGETAEANNELLKQVIAKQAEFDRKWGNLPLSIGDAVGLSETLHDMSSQIADVQAELRQHVTWEMSQKYPKG